jgi:glucoamylase
MSGIRSGNVAFGRPGLEPRWTQGNKQGVGTAYSAGSRIWFTIFQGVITETYFPTVDRPQLRDLQYLVTDGKTFFHEEKRHLETKVERGSDHALHFSVINSDPAGRYSIIKEVITHPHHACLLQKTHITGSDDFLDTLRLYVLCAPHLEAGGWNNNGHVMEIGGRRVLVAEKQGTWLVLAATVPFSRMSCGYVAASDGWTDLADNFQMDWEFDEAPDGNIALTGELDLQGRREFTSGLAFGHSLSSAATALFESLAIPFKEHRQRFIEQWERPGSHRLPLDKFSQDNGNLYHGSYSLLLAHEDKTYPGALIASLSIPWGESRGDHDEGGYHYVWTRDMVNTATGLLAAGNRVTPLRALIYLATIQHPDGRFPQNFWIDGTAYWGGIQLDEVAFPILLAWRLYRENALANFDPYPLIKRGAGYLVQHGPATAQERWEECSGYSPSTLAACIAALVSAACFLRDRGEADTAHFLEEYADFLFSHTRSWTVTNEGDLVPGISRHFIRILPVSAEDVAPNEDTDHLLLSIKNHPPDAPLRIPARNVVDAGFLELVRYGVMKPDDPLILDSLRVVDSVLKVDTPAGPCWRRYNHDGYGQRDDGGPYIGWGKGRAWPLLTGERAHYELAAGRDIGHLIRAMECFASNTGLLPEQIWDAPDYPEKHMLLGCPTTAAMPLMWAHAEYIKLLRSVRDSKVFDFIPEVADRYQGGSFRCDLEIWKPNRQVRQIGRGMVLRIQASGRFALRWSLDEWRTVTDSKAFSTDLGISFVDLPIPPPQANSIEFTFLWENGRWEGTNYRVNIRDLNNAQSKAA